MSTLEKEWQRRCTFFDEAKRLGDEAEIRLSESDELYTQLDNSPAIIDQAEPRMVSRQIEYWILNAKAMAIESEGNRLQAESLKAIADGNLVFYEAVMSAFGKECPVMWKANGDVVVVNGEEYVYPKRTT